MPAEPIRDPPQDRTGLRMEAEYSGLRELLHLTELEGDRIQGGKPGAQDRRLKLFAEGTSRTNLATRRTS